MHGIMSVHHTTRVRAVNSTLLVVISLAWRNLIYQTFEVLPAASRFKVIGMLKVELQIL